MKVTAAVVDGVDVDTVVAAVRACPGVVELDGGSVAEFATYLPGRRVLGVQVWPDAVAVRVRMAWETSVGVVAAQVRGAVVPLVGQRRVDVTIADIADPPTGQAPTVQAPTVQEPTGQEPTGQAPTGQPPPAGPPGRTGHNGVR